MDKNKSTLPAAKAAPKARRAAKPVVVKTLPKTLPGLPSDPEPPVAEVAKPALPLNAVATIDAPQEQSAAKAVVDTPMAAATAKPLPVAPLPVATAIEPKVEAKPVEAAKPAPAPQPAAPEPQAPQISSPTAAVSADSKPKDMIMDATSTIENATSHTAAKTQAMFGEAQARTQAGMEKSAKMFEDMMAFNKDNMEAMVESSKIAAKGAETLGQGAADYAKRSFEQVSQIMQTLSQVKSPTEFMKLQSDFARSSFDSMVAETSRSTEHMMKLAGEIAQPLSNRLAVAAEKMKTVA